MHLDQRTRVLFAEDIHNGLVFNIQLVIFACHTMHDFIEHWHLGVDVYFVLDAHAEQILIAVRFAD